MLPAIFRLSAAAFAAMAGFASVIAAPPDGWQLVFSDEFDGDTIDPNKWGTTMDFVGTHGPRYHNEYYLSYTQDDDVVVSDGVLRLQTQRRTVEGAEAPGVFDYTQGLVTTADKFSFTHGLIEIRAKYPGGKGLWPCIWLMPQHQGWPPEFDIAEYYAGKRTMHHGLAHGGLNDSQFDSVWDSESDFESDWHTYALEWMPGRAVWYVDGEPRKSIVADYVPDGPMYVILSNSVSSSVGPSGAPDETTPFPNSFAIDYVRIYQPPVTATTAPIVAATTKSDDADKDLPETMFEEEDDDESEPAL
jgi:beta-glucanase (GH16 family)